MTKFGVLYTNNLINPLLKVNLWHVFTEISKPEISPLGYQLLNQISWVVRGVGAYS